MKQNVRICTPSDNSPICPRV